MLIAHISDTHLGAVPYNRYEREEDFYNAFREAIDIIIKEHVKIVIHAGDIFDNPKPIGTAVNKLLKELQRLDEKNIRFLFVLGEHDISRLRSIPLARIYDQVRLAHYLDNNPYRTDNLTIIGYNKHRLNEIEKLSESLQQLDINDGKKILVLHQGLKEFNKEAGEISKENLPKYFDYYAMGHLHNKDEKWFDEFNGPICYPGSTEVTTFTDEKLEKGFYLVDLSGNEAKPNWIKLPTRKHMIVEVNDNVKVDDNYINNLINSFTDKPVIKIKFNNMDIIKARSIVRMLEEHALYVIPEYSNTLPTTFHKEKISDINEAMLKYAENILGDKEKAKFAINELLPLLLDNKEEAIELVWDVYKTHRFG